MAPTLRFSAIALASIMASGKIAEGVDWPGRERELTEEFASAPPARRADLLTRMASSAGPGADAAVVRALQDPEPQVRLTAAGLVARYRIASAAPILTAWLSEPIAETRAAGARALGALGDRSALSALTRLLGDTDTQVRMQAVEAIASIGGPEATVPLLDRLSDPEPTVRVATAVALGQLADARAVLALLGTLQDQASEVRVAVATALGRLRDERAARGLLALTRDGVPEVRLAGVRALGVLGASSAIVDLAPLLQLESIAEASLRLPLALASAEALARIGGTAARTVLARALRTTINSELQRVLSNLLAAEGGVAEDVIPVLVTGIEAERVRSIAPLLGEIRGARAAEALISLLELPEHSASAPLLLQSLGSTGAASALSVLLRAASARNAAGTGGGTAALGEQRRRAALEGLERLLQVRGRLDAEALDPLLQLLRTPPSGTEPNALRAHLAMLTRLIGGTRNPRAARALTPLLNSEHRELRAAAAQAVAQTGVEDVEDRLAEMLADPYPPVRMHAADALGSHGTAVGEAALLRVWRGSQPIDRANAARALGRIAQRTHNQAAERVLLEALETSNAETAAAIADGLSYLASQGSNASIRGLQRMTAEEVSAEAFSNALGMASETHRPPLVQALERMLDSRVPGARATATWGLGRGGAAQQTRLVALLTDAEHSVVVNAAGALGQLYAARTAPTEQARTALCGLLASRAPAAVRANVLFAATHGGFMCSLERQGALLTHSRSEFVRRAAAESMQVALRGGEAEQRLARGWLQECASNDPSRTSSARCSRLLRPAESLREEQTSIDVLVVGPDEVQPMPRTPFLLQTPAGFLRAGRTSVTGWIHERPVSNGTFYLFDPAQIPPEG